MHRARVTLWSVIVGLMVAWFVWFFRHDLDWAFPSAIALALFGIWLIGVIERHRDRVKAPPVPDSSLLARAFHGTTGPIGDVLTTISGSGHGRIAVMGLAKGTVKAATETWPPEEGLNDE